MKSYYIKNFLFFIFAYFFMHLLIRVFISPNVGLDEAEQLLLTQSISRGYNAQPPLYTWLQYVIFELFGTNVFALSILKNTLLSLTYLFVYKSAFLITKNATLSLIATASLVLLPQISWESQRALTHSVLLTTIASTVVYLLLKIKYSVSKIHVNYYIVLGILVSMGMLSKYSFAIFIFAMFISSFLDKNLRRFILKKELAITFIIVMILISPHLLWVVDNMTVVTTSTIDKLNPKNEKLQFIIGIMSLFKAVISFLAPFLIVVFFVFRKSLSGNGNKFLFNFFVITTISLILFTIVSSATHIKDRWMQPYFFLMVIFVASKINIKELKASNTLLYFKTIYFFMFVITIVLIGRVIFPDVSKRYSRLNYPYYQLSQQIKETGFNRGFIIAENKLIAGNLKLNFLDSTVSTKGFDKKVDNSQEILIVWENEFPEQAKKYKQIIKKQKMIRSRYLFSNKKDFKLNIALVRNIRNQGFSE